MTNPTTSTWTLADLNLDGIVGVENICGGCIADAEFFGDPGMYCEPCCDLIDATLILLGYAPNV